MTTIQNMQVDIVNQVMQDFRKYGLSQPEHAEDFDERYIRRCRPSGAGGFSSVFQAISYTPGQPDVIVKTTDISAIRANRQMHRYQMVIKEVQVFHVIQGIDLCSGHQNIVKLHSWFVDPKRICLVFEHLGENLYERFERLNKQPYSECDAKGILKDMAAGVEYLHDRNIVHRDLKMENVLHANADQLLPVKLIDFNLAIYKGEHNRPSPIKSTAGTKTTMDPMQFLLFANATYGVRRSPDQFYTRKCDVWALGAISYELMTSLTIFADECDCKSEHCDARTMGLDGTRGARIPGDWTLCKTCSIRFETLVTTTSFDVSSSRLRNHSMNCQDLLEGMLKYEQDDRLSIKEVLGHSWLNC